MLHFRKYPENYFSLSNRSEKNIWFGGLDHSQFILIILWYFFTPILQIHTSKIKVLCSSLNSRETLQNFLYLYKKKTQVVFFVFHFEQLSFCLLFSKLVNSRGDLSQRKTKPQINFHNVHVTLQANQFINKFRSSC